MKRKLYQADVRADAASLLHQLARHGGPMAIADRLLGADCHGIPMNPGQCPLSRYVRRNVHGAFAVWVEGSRVRIWIDPERTYAHERFFPPITIQLDYYIQEFVTNFDANAYPELIGESERAA